MSSDESEEDTNNIPDEVLEKAAEGVEEIVHKKSTILPIITNMYVQKTNNEEIQPSLNQFFRNNENIHTLSQLSRDSSTIEVADKLEQEDLISEDKKIDFLELWKQIDWITEGAPAVVQDEQGLKFRTEDYVNIQETNGTDVVIERVQHGVDELYEVRVPIVTYGRIGYNRLNILTNHLRGPGTASNFTPQEMRQLEELNEEIQDLAEMFSNMIDGVKAANRASQSQDSDQSLE